MEAVRPRLVVVDCIAIAQQPTIPGMRPGPVYLRLVLCFILEMKDTQVVEAPLTNDCDPRLGPRCYWQHGARNHSLGVSSQLQDKRQ